MRPQNNPIVDKIGEKRRHVFSDLLGRRLLGQVFAESVEVSMGDGTDRDGKFIFLIANLNVTHIRMRGANEHNIRLRIVRPEARHSKSEPSKRLLADQHVVSPNGLPFSRGNRTQKGNALGARAVR